MHYRHISTLTESAKSTKTDYPHKIKSRYHDNTKNNNTNYKSTCLKNMK